jgi:hypothetical protein
VKKLFLCVAATACLVGAGSAAALDQDGYQLMSPYLCPDFGRTQPVFNDAAPIRIKYGWGAMQTSQLDKFRSVQSGSVTVTGGPTAVAPDTWGVGVTTGWSAYFAQTLVPPGGGTTYDGWATKKYTYFGTLAPGTYTLNMDLRIDSTVNDGYGAAKKGPWLTITNCQFTVVHQP